MLIGISICCLLSFVFENSVYKNKIIFEYSSNNILSTTTNLNNFKVQTDNDNVILQILFDYDHISEIMYINNCKENESFLSFSKRYHYENNEMLLNKLNLFDCEIIASEYTPYIFLKFDRNKTINYIYEIAKGISANNFIKKLEFFRLIFIV